MVLIKLYNDLCEKVEVDLGVPLIDKRYNNPLEERGQRDDIFHTIYDIETYLSLIKS